MPFHLSIDAILGANVPTLASLCQANDIRLENPSRIAMIAALLSKGCGTFFISLPTGNVLTLLAVVQRTRLPRLESEDAFLASEKRQLSPSFLSNSLQPPLLNLPLDGSTACAQAGPFPDVCAAFLAPEIRYFVAAVYKYTASRIVQQRLQYQRLLTVADLIETMNRFFILFDKFNKFALGLAILSRPFIDLGQVNFRVCDLDLNKAKKLSGLAFSLLRTNDFIVDMFKGILEFVKRCEPVCMTLGFDQIARVRSQISITRDHLSQLESLFSPLLEIPVQANTLSTIIARFSDEASINIGAVGRVMFKNYWIVLDMMEGYGNNRLGMLGCNTPNPLCDVGAREVPEVEMDIEVEVKLDCEGLDSATNNGTSMMRKNSEF